ncbi:hypothetical protein [Erwinia sp. CGal63]|uniref:hypothetical protein n=1 Tax=Erwinia sp. CGal63 TaxID=2919889 RepID=UPI00300ADD31
MNAYIQQERYKDLQDAAEQQEAQRVSRVDVIALSMANQYPECITDFANMLNMPVEVRMFLRGPHAQDEYAAFVDRLARLQAEEHDQLIEIGFLEGH